MRPSNPGLVPPGYGGHPVYGGGAGHQLYPGHRPGGHLVAKPGTSLKYYPSLSGSETDVSTSTENLTQVSAIGELFLNRKLKYNILKKTSRLM